MPLNEIMLERLIGSIVMGRYDEEAYTYFAVALADRSAVIPDEYDVLVRAAVNAANTDDARDYLRDLVKGMIP